ncbi:MAG: CPBP family intramembrane glutamic endopeptidase, partial [Dehalococcoidia bacterium]
ETVFRGILQAKMTVALSARRGIAATAVAFALWHLVINYRTIQETNVASSAALASLAQVGSLVGLFVGGVFMSLLRHHTRNLAGPIVFHWLVVVAMTGSLFALSR